MYDVTTGRVVVEDVDEEVDVDVEVVVVVLGLIACEFMVRMKSERVAALPMRLTLSCCMFDSKSTANDVVEMGALRGYGATTERVEAGTYD